MKERQVTVGIIRRPHGLRGELAFYSHLHDTSMLLSMGSLALKKNEETKPVSVESVRGSAKSLLIKFKGYDTLESVEGLASWEIVSPRNCVSALPENEYYHFDIIGMRVLREDDSELGEITDILETGANDVYVIQGTTGKEHLIPATKEVVKRVDIDKREMVIAPLEGMIEED